jgi:4-aminobutyrate aminotransferase/(S)-3-amino-2-methylpropionate transaminase
MNALEFVKNGDPNQPDVDLCSEVVRSCAQRGLVLLSAGTSRNIIRILSPLVITDELFNKGLDIMEEEIRKAIVNVGVV